MRYVKPLSDQEMDQAEADDQQDADRDATSKEERLAWGEAFDEWARTRR